MDISGTSAIVTGGASGLGEATADALIAKGAHVVIVDRDETSGAEAAERLGEACTFVRADVTSVEDIENAIEVAAGIGGPLRVAVNCAGIAIGQRTVSRSGDPADLDGFSLVVGVNLIGTYNVATRAAAAMADVEPLEHGERGVIVNTASIAAFEGQIGQTAYAASKGGVVGLTLPMARDLASVGVRVNTIAPGIVGANPDGQVGSAMIGGLDQRYLETLAANVPFPKRLGYPDDFAQLVISIIENGYLNGETVRLDGALRMGPK